MLVTWRRWRKASAAILLVGSSVACSSSSGTSSEPSPTLITVAPSTFGAGIVCGDFPGAWKTYVVTLTDVTQCETCPKKPFALPSSNPVPCTMPVSFAWVIPGHEYTAEIDGYEQSELELQSFGIPSSGNRQMVDSKTGEEVEARWYTTCGMTIEADAGVADAEAGADADAEAGADADADADAEAGADADAEAGADADANAMVSTTGPTTAILQTNVLVRGCAPMSEIRPTDKETGIVVDLAAVQDNLECGSQPGQIKGLKVIPEDSTLAPEDAACGEKKQFSPLVADRTYRFRVEAVEAGGATPRWAASCEARTKKGVILPAVCDTLSERGSLRIDIDALLSAAGHTCTAEDVVSYQAVLLGSSLSANPATCNADAWFNALSPAFYQAAVEGQNADGDVVMSAFCDGAIKSAAATTMTCRVGSN